MRSYGLLCLLPALAMNGCDMTHSCTAALYDDTATIQFGLPTTQLQDHVFRLETKEQTCVWVQSPTHNLGAAGEGPSTRQATIPTELADLPECAQGEGGTQYEFNAGAVSSELIIRQTSPGALPELVPWLRYKIWKDGEVFAEGDVEIDYTRSEPNGEGCGYWYEGTAVVASP